MKDITKSKQIKEIVKDEYGDEIPDLFLDDIVYELYDSLFDSGYRIIDALFSLYRVEEELEIESPKAYYAFDSLLDLLNEDETTANRLYDSFLEFNDFDLFVRLIIDYDEYLSAEQRDNVKRIGIATFDKELLKMYGITD